MCLLEAAGFCLPAEWPVGEPVVVPWGWRFEGLLGQWVWEGEGLG